MGTTTAPAVTTASSTTIHSHRVLARTHTRSPGAIPRSISPRASARTSWARSAYERSCHSPSRLKRAAPLAPWRTAPKSARWAMVAGPSVVRTAADVLMLYLPWWASPSAYAQRRGGRRGLALHGAVVVEPHQRDHVTDVAIPLDPARRRTLLTREDRVIDDPSLAPQLEPELLGEGEVGGVVPVEMTDLAAPHLERELAPPAR